MNFSNFRRFMYYFSYKKKTDMIRKVFQFLTKC